MNTKDDVLTYVEEEGVKFIRLAYFDLQGKQKNVSIMPGQLARAFEKGITVDGSKAFAQQSLHVDDLILHPDPSTMTQLPWRSLENGVIHMISDLERPDGEPFEGSSRRKLKNVLAECQKNGLDLLMASKFQFYLFERDEKGNPTKIPFDQGTYMDVAPADKGENIRREICLILEEMGFDPHKSYHHEGPGQNEIDFHFSDPLSAADEASLFRWVVETCAANNGLAADFSPAPLEGKPGSALHIQVRFCLQPESVQEAFLAGLLEYLPYAQLFFNPGDDSFKRLSHPSSPQKADYSETKRNVMVRRPPLAKDVLEIRLADSKANTHLTFALVLECGLQGVREKLTLADVKEKSLAASKKECLKRLKKEGLPEWMMERSMLEAFLEIEEERC